MLKSKIYDSFKSCKECLSVEYVIFNVALYVGYTPTRILGIGFSLLFL